MAKKYIIGAACFLALIASGFAWAKVSSSPVSSPINYTCQSDADCTVKDVGNCCGYYPACVNVKAVTNPEALKAQCAKDGMASICGFEEIQSCSCVSNRCVSAGGTSAQ